jgi:hypothetical protein
MPLPPLRLYHLFALTAVVAILLTSQGLRPLAAALGDDKFPRWLLSVLIGTGVIVAIIHAIAITFVLFSVAWRRQGVWTYTQPGHWLFVSIATTSALGVFFALGNHLIRWLFDGWLPTVPSSGRGFLWWYLLNPENIVIVALNVYIGGKRITDQRWARIFYWKAVATIVPVFGDLAILHLMQLVGREERRAHVERDAAHRCGFWIQYVASGLTVLIAFAFLAAFVSMMPFW